MAFIKIFSGSVVNVQRVKQLLQEQGIEPVVKDNSASASVAGFGTLMPDYQELFVHSDEEAVALELIKNLS